MIAEAAAKVAVFAINKLKLSLQNIHYHLEEGWWSQRAIALERIDRQTVGKYLQSVPQPATEVTAESLPTTASPGQQSLCETWRAEIQAAVQAGLSTQRNYQDLVGGHPFAGSYQSVKRFVRKLAAAMPLPFRRMECEPGHEVQVCCQ